MKTLFTKILSISFTATMLFALDIPNKNQTDISKLVNEIKSAKPENKRELINQLKVRLRGLNREVRQKTMMDLRDSFAKNGGLGHRFRKNKNCPVNSEERSQNLQQAGQRGGKRAGPRDGSGPHYNDRPQNIQDQDRPHKNNGQPNRGR